MQRGQSTPRLGVYGFQIEGLREPERFLVAVEPGAPTLTVVHEAREPFVDRALEPGTVRVEPDKAELWMADGDRILLDRATLTARFVTRERFDDEVLLHPYLGLPAAIASHWLGRQTLHGGAFRRGGGAWAVVGARAAGKSSILAWVLQHGHEVMTDDILILERGHLFAGPRSVDLRGEAAVRLGGEELGVVGSRSRWRLRPEAVPPRAPLAGLVHLRWDDRIAIDPLRPPDRLEAIVQHCVIRPRREESLAYLELASLPAWRFTRPRNLDALDGANAALLDALGAPDPPSGATE